MNGSTKNSCNGSDYNSKPSLILKQGEIDCYSGLLLVYNGQLNNLEWVYVEDINHPTNYNWDLWGEEVV